MVSFGGFTYFDADCFCYCHFKTSSGSNLSAFTSSDWPKLREREWLSVTFPHVPYTAYVLHEIPLRRQWNYTSVVLRKKPVVGSKCIDHCLCYVCARYSAGSGQRRENPPSCLHPGFHVSALGSLLSLSIMSKGSERSPVSFPVEGDHVCVQVRRLNFTATPAELTTADLHLNASGGLKVRRASVWLEGLRFLDG